MHNKKIYNDNNKLNINIFILYFKYIKTYNHPIYLII
jgi:hypothetical protein